MITATGAVIGLAIAIVLIVKKFNPAYSLILGSLIGGLLGGAGLMETVNFMIKGAQGMMPAILRIITAGILAGVLIETGAANKIAETIVDKLGENKAIFALVISTFLLTAVEVFLEISVITVSSILIAMIGGGKSGNIISPNPNAIAASESFGIPLTSVMFSGLIPAIVGIIITVIIAGMMARKGVKILDSDVEVETGVKEKPAFLAAIAGPVCAILLLALRPIANIVIDPLIALPIGGLIGCIAMGKIKNIDEYCKKGLNKMIMVAVILIGTGTLAGIIANSNIKDIFTSLLSSTGAPAFLLAPLSGILMSAATASTTSGTAVASKVFGPSIVSLGVKPLSAAAMIRSGATVLDHLPHGSFFHATAGAVNMEIKDRLLIIPFESLIGLILTIVSTILFGIFGL